MQKYKFWTSAEEAKLIKLFNDGFSTTTVAEKLGRSPMATATKKEQLMARGHSIKGKRTKDPQGESFTISVLNNDADGITIKIKSNK